jgi:flagellar basal body rod protein FlgG
MNTSNNSNASSVAVTSNHRTVANNVANLRRYGCRASFGAFAAIPYQALRSGPCDEPQSN